MKSKFLSLLSLFFVLASSAFTQTPAVSSSEILLNLQKLNTVGSALYIAAHPDDENTRLLTYLSKERKVRTGYLSITRGDGGQNLIGKEQGEPLGLIRTHELLAARRTDGAEQFFTRAYDFGYSKTPEETFSFWNKDSILYDMVYVIRTFKPDVLICRFPTTGEGGHGHHTASAILAVEAFDAAADPKRFPDQLKSLQPWQAKRIVWNTFNFGTNNTISEDQLKIDVGGYNTLLGKSYGEISAESRSMHKSQGFGSAKTRGTQLEYFKHIKGDEAKSDLFDNINLTWTKISGASDISKQIELLIAGYSSTNPEKSLNGLLSLRNSIQKLNGKDALTSYWTTKKLNEINELIIQCSGLWFEAYASEPTLTPGQQAEFNTTIVLRNNAFVKLEKIIWFDNDTTTNLELKQNASYTFKHNKVIPASIPYSNPYWLNEDHPNGSFIIKDRSMLTKPENQAALTAKFFFRFNDQNIEIQRPVVYKRTDPVKGEVYRPIEVLPPVTINLSEKAYVFAGKSKKIVSATIKSTRNKLDGTIVFEIPKGWTSAEDNFQFSLTSKGEEKTFSITLVPDGKSESGKLTVSALIDGKPYSYSLRRIEYDHIPEQIILSEAEAKLVMVDLKRNGSNIGYIPGAGDDVPAALRQVGYNVSILTDEILADSDLSNYDAIVTGVRAYNTNDRLQIYYNKLMKYIEDGGNLIVQYNTNNRIGPIVAKISPYSLNITRERVTDETSPVTFAVPEHSSLTTPNKITEADFKDWIQERGIYFANDISKEYATPLMMSDPNGKPNEGSLLIAKHGKGNFVYTGIVFFRQLPAGVPGAFRLFANLLSLPENK